ncbi:uncharacterized protein LOC131937277 isoform X2 [Physella acuta]|uniref:uncharacterized protein LOC131937277 isoform X2 n=1 Tax=Physella acuta TaxID=109671 RepID=UPI0027DE2328|nr:uncharacterized protein LOC131937277 isoform X2 [Physella acuta]
MYSITKRQVLVVFYLTALICWSCVEGTHDKNGTTAENMDKKSETDLQSRSADETSPIKIKKRPGGETVVVQGYTSTENPKFTIDYRCSPAGTGKIAGHLKVQLSFNPVRTSSRSYGMNKPLTDLNFYDKFDFKLHQKILIEHNTHSDQSKQRYSYTR